MKFISAALVVLLSVSCRPKDKSLTETITPRVEAMDQEAFGPDVSGLPDGVHNVPWEGGEFWVMVQAGRKEGPAKLMHANGAVGWQGSYQHDLPHGWVEQRDSSGAMIASGHYANGRKEGHWQFYHTDCLHDIALPVSVHPAGRWASQKPVAEGRMEGGAPRGYWILRYPNGMVRLEGDLRDGTRNGWWRSYDEQGWLEHEGQYVDGEREGYQMHYVDGVLREEGSLCRGSRCGTWKRYDAQGEPEAVEPANEGGGLLPF